MKPIDNKLPIELHLIQYVAWFSRTGINFKDLTKDYILLF